MSKSSSKDTARNLTAAATCLALCMVLPFLTGQIPQFGMALAPMHIPVLLCGYITGPAYAMIIGLIAPLLRMILFGAPMPFMAVSMCFELAVYGLMAGLLYKSFPKKTIYIYVTLLLSMLIGRFTWGLATWQLVTTGIFPGQEFSWELFIAGAFTNALPGIILHIILIPLLVIALRKARLVD